MIGLVDCNSFYVSCERVFQPRLRGLPVGVMSNNDGCVIALSNELKALGITMGTPAFEIQHLVRQGRIHLLSSNYELYGDMSQRVQSVLEEFSPGVEPYSIDEIREALRQHGQRGAEKLRRQGSLARAVMVFLKTNPFRQDLPQYSPSLVVELRRPTDDSREILHAAGYALERIYRKGYLYQKGGVMLLDLVDANRQQLSLLDTPQSEAERQRSAKLMNVMDDLNRRMGRGTVKLGTPSPGAAWHLRCANLTQRYTTRWEELPAALAQ